jgi:hypothetical protein
LVTLGAFLTGTALTTRLRTAGFFFFSIFGATAWTGAATSAASGVYALAGFTSAAAAA